MCIACFKRKKPITSGQTHPRTSPKLTKPKLMTPFAMDDGKKNDSGHLELVGAIDHRDAALSLPTALAELALVIFREARVDNEQPATRDARMVQNHRHARVHDDAAAAAEQ